MKLVILAAGKGKRMGESSNHTPKPILKYQGKTLLYHKIEQLPSEINEVIIVIGHLGNKIVKEIGHSYRNINEDSADRLDTNLSNKKADTKNIPITYVVQTELLGTADSLWRTRTRLGSEPFLILMGDDLYAKKDLEEMIRIHKEHGNAWVALVHPQDEHIPYGKCILDEDGFLIDFRNDLEKIVPENLMYTGACILTPEVFKLPMKKVGAIEYGLPQTFIQEERHVNAKNKTVSVGEDGVEENKARQDVYIVKTSFWKRITAPEDLEN